MTRLDPPKEKVSHEPATNAAPGEFGGMAAPASRKRSKFSHQIWTRADGFTLSGPRRV